MKPFWKKPRKKKPKKQSKPAPKTRPTLPLKAEPWKPPYPPKLPVMPEKPKYERPPKAPNTVHKPRTHEKEFLSTFRQLLSERSRPWDIWKDFIIMSACALSNPVDKTHYEEREKRYLDIIQKYEPRKQVLFPELFAHMVMALEKDPEQDFLGKMYMKLNLGYDELKQVFTPYHVCQLMADITIGDIVSQVEKQGYITIDDPCCGAGANLIAVIHTARHKLEKAGLNYQNHLLVTGQDIEEVVALMCYIQLSLLGVAGFVKVGNTITEPMSPSDTTENYWFTPMYFNDVWCYRRIAHRIDTLTRGEGDSKLQA